MRQFVIAILVSIFVAGLTIAYVHSTASRGENATARETTYDRVMRTGEIRCGYSVWDPLFYIDPQSHEEKASSTT